MKIYTSYFYMIRFMPPNIIPISTARWDPKWFNNYCGQGHVFIDKRGVINGVRSELLVPNKNCDSGDFLTKYREQLESYKFEDVLRPLIEFANGIKDVFNFKEEPAIALIVYEAPSNPNSERVPLQEWFAANGYPIEEYLR